jgi:hypothetical protein
MTGLKTGKRPYNVEEKQLTKNTSHKQSTETTYPHELPNLLTNTLQRRRILGGECPEVGGQT